MPDEHEPDTSAASWTLEEAQSVWATLVHVGEAAVHLRQARDLVLLGRSGTLGASTLHILHETCLSLAREMGQALLALRDHEDASVRDYVRLLIARLHAPPPLETVPPDDEQESSA